MPSQALATAMAPPFALVLRHLAAAVGAFVLLAVLLLLEAPLLASGAYLHPRVLALVHLAGLGWVGLTIMGASYQLVPVILEVPLWSVRTARATFWIYLAGLSGVVGHMGMEALGPGLWFAGALTLLGLGLFGMNLSRTLWQASRWDATAWHLATSLGFLALAVLLGLALAVHLGRPWLPAAHTTFLPLHAHLALGGWVGLVVMGVAYKLIPMFNLAHGYSMKPARWAWAGVTAGLAAWVLGALLRTGLLVQAARIILALGMALFLVQMLMIHRRRLRRSLDVGLRHASAAWAFTVLALVLGILSAWAPAAWSGRISTAYGAAVFLGSLSLLIAGMLYKIVPFLTWFHRYSDRVGRDPVPLLHELYSEPLARVQLWFLALSVAVLVPSLAGGHAGGVAAASAGLLVSAGLLGYNMLRVLRHRPRT